MERGSASRTRRSGVHHIGVSIGLLEHRHPVGADAHSNFVRPSRFDAYRAERNSWNSTAKVSRPNGVGVISSNATQITGAFPARQSFPTTPGDVARVSCRDGAGRLSAIGCHRYRARRWSERRRWLSYPRSGEGPNGYRSSACSRIELHGAARRAPATSVRPRKRRTHSLAFCRSLKDRALVRRDALQGPPRRKPPHRLHARLLQQRGRRQQQSEGSPGRHLRGLVRCASASGPTSET